jgi:Zn-dependent protease
MILNLLFDQPILFLAWTGAILAAITIHEFSHALMADVLGDSTAKREGRLTLNPLAHLDPMGTILLLLVGFGWGRPVPFNPYNLKNQKWGPALVAGAGPFSNLIMAIVFGFILRFASGLDLGPENLGIKFLAMLVFLNLILMAFNLIPVPPLDGSKVLFAFLHLSEQAKFILEHHGPFFLLMLIIFDRFLPISILGTVLLGLVGFLGNLIVPGFGGLLF